MQKLLIALNEGLIDKNNLLLKKGNLLNLTSDEIVFLLKLINFDLKFTLSQICKNLQISKTEFEQKIAPFLKSKLVKIIMKDNGKSNIFFDFSKLWEKLLVLSIEPSDEDLDFSFKYKWFLAKMNLEESEIFKDLIFQWLEDGNFYKMKLIVNSLPKNQKITISFEDIKKFMFSKSNLQIDELKKIKELISENWIIK